MKKPFRKLVVILLLLGLHSLPTAAQEKFKLFGMALSVKNMEASIKWYGDVLGFKVLERSEYPLIKAKTVFIEGAGIRLELLQAENSFRLDALFAAPPNHMRLIGNKALILYVEDLETVTRQLEKKKVVFVFKLARLNDQGLTSTIIRDPDGNFISIFDTKGMIPINDNN